MKQNKMAIIAIVCGTICAICVMAFMMHVRGEADTARAEALARFGGEQVEAYVATRDIVAGERVDLSAVETKLWVADLLPENAVRSSSDVVGKTATSSIFKGEVFVASRFEYDHDAIDVPQGKQAVSVPAKAVQAVGGAIRAGMMVDIYSSGDSATAVLAQNVTVLDTSVGASGSLASGGGGWITLAVDPDRVQEIIAASNKTSLYFTLPSDQAGAANGASSSEDDAGLEAGAQEDAEDQVGESFSPEADATAPGIVAAASGDAGDSGALEDSSGEEATSAGVDADAQGGESVAENPSSGASSQDDGLSAAGDSDDEATMGDDKAAMGDDGVTPDDEAIPSGDGEEEEGDR